MKRNSKAYDLTKEFLEKAGFISCEFVNGNWVIKRIWRVGSSKNVAEKEIHISTTNDYHPYGYDQKAPVISFSCGKKHYSISWPRFLWAWKKGSISKDVKVRKIDDKNIWPDSFELVDIHDHSYYKKYNAALVIKEMIEGKRSFKF